MKYLISLFALLLASQSFAISGLYQGDFDGAPCFLSVEVESGGYAPQINVSSMEEPEDGPKDRHQFSMSISSFEDEIEGGQAWFTNLPSESSNLLSWVSGIGNKTYNLVYYAGENGVPTAYELMSKKEGRDSKTLVTCRGLQKILN